MTNPAKAARSGIDTTSDGDVITSGAKTVFIGSQGSVPLPGSIVTGVASKGATITSGCTTVMIENKMAARMTDALSDGSIIASGDPTVFIGFAN
jgi:uncharacterized Zn-binding protein involved in type VI secretion